MKALVVILAAAGLVGCVTPEIRSQCLPLKAYTADQEIAMAQALDALPADSPLIPLIQDYGAMRDGDRACLAAAK